MNRSRGWMFALVLGGLLMVTGAIWLLGGLQASSDAVAAPAAQAAMDDGGIELPEARDSAAEALQAPEQPAGKASVTQAAPEDAPTRTLKGRAVMEDRGALPSGLAVYAARRQPAPTLFTMRDIVGQVQRPESLEEDFGIEADKPDGRGQLVPVGADGRFELPASARQAWLGVVGTGVYVDPPVHVPPGEEHEIELLLVRGAVLEGRVLDAAGAPLAGRRVRAATPFDPYGILDAASRMASLGSVSTDAEGRFLFPQVPAGLALQIVGRNVAGPGAPELAEGPALQPARAAVPALAVGERRSLNLVLRPAGSVSGFVLRKDDSPVPNVRVALKHSSVSMSDIGTVGDDKELKATTGADGAFLFPCVNDGTYEAVISQQGLRVTRSPDLVIRDGAPIADVRLLADTGLTISGRVLDLEGQPVPTAVLRAYPPPGAMSFGGAFDRELRPQVTANADGSFVLDGLDAGEMQIEVDASGYHDKSTKAKAGDTGVEIRIEKLTTLSGIVVSLTDGEPVRSFSIVLQPAGGMFDAMTLFGGGDTEDKFERIARGSFTGREDGTFTIEGVTPGAYDAFLTARGFGLHTEQNIEVPKEGRRGVVMMLEPEASVFGVLVDMRSGTPVIGAAVRTSSGSSMSDMMNGMVRPAATARSDSAGRFQLGGLATGTVKLVIEHAQYTRLGLADLTLTAGEQKDLGTLRMSKGATVFGTVFDAIGVVPDCGMMVSNSTGSVVKRSSTDSQGHYRVEGLPPGTYSVMRMDFAMGTGGDAAPSDILENIVYEQVTLAENEEKRVDLRVATTGGIVLSGRVTDAAGPVAGAVLTLMPGSPGAKIGIGRSDDDGLYTIDHVVSGRYELSVMTTDGMGPAQGSIGSSIVGTLELGSRAEERHDVQLPGGVLNGVVVNKKDDHAVPGVRIVLVRTDSGIGSSAILKAIGGRVGETYSGENGAFRFRHLPGGTYEIHAGGKGILGTGAAGWTARRVDNVSVLEGKPGFTVRVEVEPAAVVAGTLTGPDGQPLAATGVWVLDAAGTPRSVFSEVMSDSSGSYEVGDLQPGAWTLAFMDGSHALTVVRDVQVKAEQRVPLDVRLPDGVPLRLNLAGRPAGTIDVGVTGPTGPLPTRLITMNDLTNLPAGSGDLAVGTYAPGNYRVVVTAPGTVLLDSAITLALGTGPKVVDLPSP